MKEILLFKKMITPTIIVAVFYVLAAFCVIAGIVALFNKIYLPGLALIILCPILLRIVCEFMILMFRIYDKLSEIKDRQGV
jgi:hypothetical protein